MQPVRGDADFGAQTIFEAICKTCRQVYVYRPRVDFELEALGGPDVFGHDGFSVSGAIAFDMFDGVIKGIYDTDCQNGSKVFGFPVFVACGLCHAGISMTWLRG